MKKLNITFLTIFLSFNVAINAQKKDSIKQPEEKIEVNKEFDKDGNLIRYDSIYRYSSSSNLNMDAKKMDSIMKQFFPNRESMLFGDTFDDLDFGFPNLFLKNFSNFDSILQQRLEDHHKQFDSIIKKHRPKREQSPPNKI
ncbi:hypothetical protein [Flavivirga rizhaonensis]|uniref:Uncharacterized protein n=1 Tax=Flavivirga rizhaonensis TaxID=2559571 RepID=A0A4S1E260_9FLAO|nr:hypothetical protein [Flavivirga rizhaonensis]TGV04697.1 hypothetical protein EM932_00800 [Flavivirga rizhaonensis]